MPQVQPPSLLLLPSRPVPLTAMTDHTPTPRVVRAIDPVERINELERELKMTLQMLSDARTERDEARRSLANSAHVANAARVIAWARDPNRKPANTAFTAGAERQAAYWIEWAQLHDALPTGGLPPSDVEAYAGARSFDEWLDGRLAELHWERGELSPTQINNMRYAWEAALQVVPRVVPRSAARALALARAEGDMPAGVALWLPAFIKAVRHLAFQARTSGGTAGRDEGLCAALDAVEALLPPVGTPEEGRS